MHQTIVGAMMMLSEAGIVFALEDEFQLELGKKLEQMTSPHGWSWSYWRRNEEKFETAALANEKTIKVDLVGRHPNEGMVAIELKYVRGSPRRGGAPSNPPGFPYDIAKDCLRLDLLDAGQCKPAGKPIPDNFDAYVIALTDWPDYWQDRKPKAGWAANFYNVIRSSAVRFDHVIRTLGSNSENTIALGRCHIAFGRPWTGSWSPYGSNKQGGQFRYLLLRPAPDVKPQWTTLQQQSVIEQSANFPFLSKNAREGWQKRNASKKRRRNRQSEIADD